MEHGPDPEIHTLFNHEDAWARLALAAAGVSRWDRFDYGLFCGLPPKEVLREILQSISEDTFPAAEERMDTTVELINRGRVDFMEAVEVLEGYGFHELSLFGARGIGESPMKATGCKKLLGLPLEAHGEAFYIRPGGGFSLKGFRELGALPPGLKVNFLHLTSLPNLQVIGEGLEVFRSLRIEGCPALQALPPQTCRRLGIWISGCPAFTGFSGPVLASAVHLVRLPALDRLALDAGFRGSVTLRECPGLRWVCLTSGRILDLDLFRSGVEEVHNLSRVDEHMNLAGCPNLSKLEGPLTVGGTMRLEDLPSLWRLGTGIKIKQALHLKGMPEGFELPEDLEVGGAIHMHPPCGHVQIPESLANKVVWH